MITHRFVNPKADGGDATIVRPSNWNDSHIYDLTITAKSVNYTITDADETTHVTTGVSTIVITLHTAVGRAGRMFRIYKVDSGAGIVSILTTSSQTISSQASWQLNNQWQYLRVYSDGANWVVDGAN